MITSTVAGEGKSTVVANLGVVMAQDGKKVLIIDCDMRNPAMHKYFTMDNYHGLSNLLRYGAEIDDVIKGTGIAGLSLIPGGPIPPNPAELLSLQRMRYLLSNAKAKFDLVLLDTPAAIAVTDAAVLASSVNGVLLVLKAGSTAIEKVQSVKMQLEIAGANIIGVVLNDLKIKRREYGHYYRSREQEQLYTKLNVLSEQVASAKDSE